MVGGPAAGLTAASSAQQQSSSIHSQSGSNTGMLNDNPLSIFWVCSIPKS